MTTETFELDAGLDFCPCGTLTANPWGYCSRCTEAEWNDREWNRSSGAVDPNAGIG